MRRPLGSPARKSHSLALCLARYLSLHFFFFPKGLQLGASAGAAWAALAALLWMGVGDRGWVLSGGSV